MDMIHVDFVYLFFFAIAVIVAIGGTMYFFHDELDKFLLSLTNKQIFKIILCWFCALFLGIVFLYIVGFLSAPVAIACTLLSLVLCFGSSYLILGADARWRAEEDEILAHNAEGMRLAAENPDNSPPPPPTTEEKIVDFINQNKR